MKHTPGQWKIVRESTKDFESYSYYIPGVCSYISEIEIARLIAAAPDLLEALQAICNDGIHCAILPILEEKARAAIEKATGGEG